MTKSKKNKKGDRRSPSKKKPWGWIWGGIVVIGLALLSWILGTRDSVTMDRATNGTSTIPVFSFNVVGTYPHDAGAFTQGFIVRNGTLYESTGGYGNSTLRRVHLETGVIDHRIDLPGNLFGEGLAWFQGQLIQLTWRSGVARVYDGETFELKRELTYRGQGWGLTHDGLHLIQSDGSDRLTFRDAIDFSVVRSIRVTADGESVNMLNELEFVNGEVWANVYQTDRIVRIDPATGNVKGWVDLSGLHGGFVRRRGEGVLNGIAYDADQDRLFVTGKNWPKIYEIQVEEREP